MSTESIKNKEHVIYKDKASPVRNVSIGDRLRTISLSVFHGVKFGTGCAVRKNVQIVKTDNAVCKFGDNVFILDDVLISLTKPEPKLIVGNDVSIAQHTIISVKKLVRIGSYVRIGPFVHIIDHDHSFSMDKLIMDQPAKIEEIIIGEDVWIGSGARILKGVTIGEGAVIGANTVVTRDVPPNAVFVGNPGKVIKYRVEQQRK